MERRACASRAAGAAWLGQERKVRALTCHPRRGAFRAPREGDPGVEAVLLLKIELSPGRNLGRHDGLYKISHGRLDIYLGPIPLASLGRGCQRSFEMAFQ